MADEQKSKLRLEIAHVLFIDIVGYSKLRTNEQSAQIETLRNIVRETEQFRAADAEGKVLRLPTGDGGALAFRNSPEAPVLCAGEIAKALKNHPEIRVRMGIHSGPVNEVTDLNEQANIAGAGINIAQRMMDCGDAGHILVSKHAAEDLEQYDQWQPYLHDLGECEGKHGERLHVVNVYNNEIGNSAVPAKCARKNIPGTTSSAVGSRRRYSIAMAIGALIVVGATAFFFATRTAFRGLTRPRQNDFGKKHRCPAVPKPQRRQIERLLYRRYPGRNSDPTVEDRRAQGHFPQFHSEIQERAGQPARGRQTVGRCACSRR